MIKFITPCALLLALAATSAVHAADLKIRPDRCDNRVAVEQASERDPSLDQLAADARAVWHDLTPDVREMVDELLVSRGLSLDRMASVPLQPLQTQHKRNIVTLGSRCEAAQRVSAVPPLPGRRASAIRPA